MKITKSKVLFFLAGLLIIGLYFAFRLTNILGLPIFTDEAIYVRWSQIAAQDASWRFISLTDGKQPMFVWIGMVLMKFFTDPLLAGRMVSVFAGIGSVIGMFFLGNELFRDRAGKIFHFTNKSISVGLLSSLIYVLYPFALVYDRMAMYDSLVGFFSVWTLYLFVLMVRTTRLDVALLAGLVAGGGVLTKTNAFLSIFSIPLLLLIADWNKGKYVQKIIRLASLSLVVLVLSYGMYMILRLSPFFHIIGEKNELFVYPVREWIKSPFSYFGSNITALIDWFVTYFSIPAIILVIASFFVNRKNLREKLILIAWFVFPFISLAFFGKTIYPRFIFFMTLPLLPLLAYSIFELIEKYKNVAIRVAVVVFAFSVFLYTDYFVIYNFQEAPIAKADLGQYINGWSAGNGVKQSVQLFLEESNNQKIYVVTEGTFGLMPYGLELYLADKPNVEINALWPIKNTPPDEVLAATDKMPTYAIFYQPCPDCSAPGQMPEGWKGELIATYKQGTSDSYYSVYKLKPTNE